MQAAMTDRGRATIRLNSHMSNVLCVFNHILPFLPFIIQNLSERVLPFVSECSAAHNRACIGSTHPPQIPVQRGSVSRGGMRSF